MQTRVTKMVAGKIGKKTLTTFKSKSSAAFIAAVLLGALFTIIDMQPASAHIATGIVHVPNLAMVTINGGSPITCMVVTVGCDYSTTTESDEVEIELSGLLGPGTVTITDTEGDDTYDVQGSGWDDTVVVVDGPGNDHYSGDMGDGMDDISINDAVPAGSTQPSPFGPGTIPLPSGEGDDWYEFHGGPSDDKFEGVLMIAAGVATVDDCYDILNGPGSDRYILYGDEGNDDFCRIFDGEGSDKYTFNGDDDNDDFFFADIFDGPGNDRYSYSGGPGFDDMEIEIHDDTGGDRYSVDGGGEDDEMGLSEIFDGAGVDRYLIDGGPGTETIPNDILDLESADGFNIFIVLGFP